MVRERSRWDDKLGDVLGDLKGSEIYLDDVGEVLGDQLVGRRFDRIVMNPPFTMRADIRHVIHAQKFLKFGGRLVGLCMAGKQREEKLRPLATVWEPIPAGMFREAGTNIETVMFTIEN